MTDTRLSDLCVLAVERDFDINFEKLINDFADAHKTVEFYLSKAVILLFF